MSPSFKVATLIGAPFLFALLGFGVSTASTALMSEGPYRDSRALDIPVTTLIAGACGLGAALLAMKVVGREKPPAA